MRLLIVLIQHIGRTQSRPPQQFLRPAHRPPHPHRDLPHRVPLGQLQPQNLAVERRQRAQHLARGDAHEVRRLSRPLRQLLPRHHPSLFAQVIAARMAHRAEEPRPHVANRFACGEKAEEDVVHQRLRLIGRHAELRHRIPLKTVGQLAIPLFRSHCCRESHESPGFRRHV